MLLLALVGFPAVFTRSPNSSTRSLDLHDPVETVSPPEGCAERTLGTHGSRAARPPWMVLCIAGVLGRCRVPLSSRCQRVAEWQPRDCVPPGNGCQPAPRILAHTRTNSDRFRPQLDAGKTARESRSRTTDSRRIARACRCSDPCSPSRTRRPVGSVPRNRHCPGSHLFIPRAPR